LRLKSILFLFVFIFSLNSYATTQNQKIKLQLQWKHQFEFAGFYMAKEKGFYQKFGIDVEFVEFDGKTNITDKILNEENQIGVWGSGIINEWLNGKDVVFLANYFKRSPLALITKPEIRTPEDLVGKRVMIPFFDVSSASFQQMFKFFNISKDSLNIVEPNFKIPDFEKDNIDASSTFLPNEPYYFIKNGIPYNILDPNNYGVEFYDVNLFSSRKFVEQNSVLIKDFIEATNKGWDYALKNVDETVNVILEKYNTQNKTKDALIFEANESKKFILQKNYPLGSIDINKVKKISELYIELGFAPKRDNLEDLLFISNESTISLTNKEKAFLKDNPIIKVSNEINFPPFDFSIGGEPYGFSIDLLNLLSKKIGLKFEYVNGNWVELYNDFKDKKIDLLHTLSKTSQRENDGFFSEPYLWYQTHFIIRKDNPDIQNIEDLNGKILVVGKYWASEEYISKNYPKIKLLVVDSFEDMLEAVSKGEAYALIGENLIFKYLTKKRGFTNLKLSLPFDEFNSLERTSYRFLVSKDKPILNQLLNKGLKSLTFKELNELEEKWFGKENDIKEFDNSSIKLNEEEVVYLSKKRLIKMCVDPNWMPLERINENGLHEGISADLIKTMSHKLNLNIELVKTSSWKQSLDFIKNKECDILSLAMKTKEREEYLDFTTPYFSSPFVIATLDKELFVENIEHILDKKIALVKDYAFTEFLKKKYPNTKFVEVNNVKEGLTLLSEKKVFAFIDTLISIGYTIKENSFYNIKVAGKLDEKWELSIATRNDESILNKIFEKAVNSLSDNDKQIAYNKWFSIKFEQSVDYSMLWKILIPIFLLIFISTYWNRKLYSEKEKTKKALDSLKKLQDILEIKNFELQRISNTDKLTTLYNRHKLDEVLKYELSRFNRTNISFGLIILDIDFFKDINDTFGHNIGDEVLVEISSLLKKNVRSSDILGRWGGEEFLIIAPDSKEKDLLLFAEKLRKEIENYNFGIVGKKTCSFGVTISKNNDTETSIVNRADKALYIVKNSGRNKVQFL